MLSVLLDLTPMTRFPLDLFASQSLRWDQPLHIAGWNPELSQSFDRFAPILARARELNLPVRGYLSTIIACPFDGPTPDATYLGDGIKNGGGVTLEYVGGAAVDRMAFGPSAPELPPLGGRLHHSYTRRFGGCIDTGDYYVDFEHALTQSPQTSAAGATPC